MKNYSTFPWLCVGDFNEIVTNEEKLGKARRPARQMEIFKKALVDCELNKLQVTGGKFTWPKGKIQMQSLKD